MDVGLVAWRRRLGWVVARRIDREKTMVRSRERMDENDETGMQVENVERGMVRVDNGMEMGRVR